MTLESVRNLYCSASGVPETLQNRLRTDSKVTDASLKLCPSTAALEDSTLSKLSSSNACTSISDLVMQLQARSQGTCYSTKY